MSVIEQVIATERSKHRHAPTLRRSATAAIKRRLLFRYRRPPRGPAYLNLGAGTKHYEGFCSADHSAPLRFLWERQPAFWLLDASRPWPCDNDRWAGIFSEHMLEHLDYAGAIHAMRECLRTTEPGGWLRVITPDLGKYAACYQGQPPNERFERFTYGALAISTLTQNAGHRSVWDAELMMDALTEVGWTGVREARFGEGGEPALLRDSPERRWTSLYVKCRKPA